MRKPRAHARAVRRGNSRARVRAVDDPRRRPIELDPLGASRGVRSRDVRRPFRGGRRGSRLRRPRRRPEKLGRCRQLPRAQRVRRAGRPGAGSVGSRADRPGAGGALRDPRARAFRERMKRRDPPEDVRAAVVTLGEVPESDPESETWSLRVDVRSIETVEGVVRASFGLSGDEGDESGETKTAVKTVERLVTTTCALRRGARGAWEVARDGSERTCTAKCACASGADASAALAVPSAALVTDGVAYATRVEIVLGPQQNLNLPPNATSASVSTKRSPARAWTRSPSSPSTTTRPPPRASSRRK